MNHEILKKEGIRLAGLAAVFLACYFLPLDSPRFQAGLQEGMAMVRWYAREHVLLCLVPAFFIAGAIATFVRQKAVMRYLGPSAPKPLAYGVASVSGTVLAVCSCTVLPLFAGIWRMGAGLGAAVAFLYSGPAISALAIILTARILGFEIGLARSIGAIGFALVIGALMAWIFRAEESARTIPPASEPQEDTPARPLWKTALWIGLMAALLIFANWSDQAAVGGLFAWIAGLKWALASASAAGLGLLMVLWFHVAGWKVLTACFTVAMAAYLAPGNVLAPFGVGTAALAWITASSEGEMGEWWEATWAFTKAIAPLLLGGVFLSGMLLGRPGEEGLIPSTWIASAVGGESLQAVVLSSVIAAFMYFATLTEIPILQGLLGSGMGKGPALALLLAGPALSLPSMLALGKILGAKKTLVYCLLVIVMASATGWLYGRLF